MAPTWNWKPLGECPDPPAHGGLWIALADEGTGIYLVRQFINWKEVHSKEEYAECPHQYQVIVSACLPRQVEPEDRDPIINHFGCKNILNPDNWQDASEELKVEAMHGYGTCAQVLDREGDNWQELIAQTDRRLREEYTLASMSILMSEFYQPDEAGF